MKHIANVELILNNMCKLPRAMLRKVVITLMHSKLEITFSEHGQYYDVLSADVCQPDILSRNSKAHCNNLETCQNKAIGFIACKK